jgi:hypothetical protein
MEDLLLRRAERAGRWSAMPGSVLASSGAPWQVVTAGHGTAVGPQSRAGTSAARRGAAARPDASSKRRLCHLRALAWTEQTDDSPAREASRSRARRTTGLPSCRPDPLQVVSPGASCTRRAEAVSHVAFGELFGTVTRGGGRRGRRAVPSGFGEGVWETRPLLLKRARRQDQTRADPRLICLERRWQLLCHERKARDGEQLGQDIEALRLMGELPVALTPRIESARVGTVSQDSLGKPDGTRSATPRPLPNGVCETRDTLRRRVARPCPTWHTPRLPSPGPSLGAGRVLPRRIS